MTQFSPGPGAKRQMSGWRGVPGIIAAVFLALLTDSGFSSLSASSPGAHEADGEDWPSFGRTASEQHYSPLVQISIATVARLGLAWQYELPADHSLSGPVAAEGKVFVTTGHSYIRAFDAKTGSLLWEFDSGTRARAGVLLRLNYPSKGIAYWEGRVFLATMDGRIIALDAGSGKVAWEQQDFERGDLRYINGPPRVFDGKLIIGHGGADVFPIRGYVSCYDARTGRRLWRFYTVPGDPSKGFENSAMQMAAKTWSGKWWQQGGGGTAWNAFSYDPLLNLIYIGVGNGYPYNQALRSPGGGDNLFLSSIVALRADTGAYVWHYQVCNGEQWDCTATQDMTLATIKIGGRERQVLMQAPKNGFFYVLDRATGELISAEPFARTTWASRIDYDTGRPVENPGVRYHGKDMFELWPGVRGAHSWLPQSFSPRTGLVYLPVIEGASIIGDKGLDLSDPGIGLGINLVPDPDLPGARRSFLKAWDPVTQRPRWVVELPGDWPAGTMATAGDLVFQGRIDGKFVAYDAATGRVVWSFQVDAPIVAPPITYAIDGKQYVTVLTGSGASGGGMFSPGLAAYRTDFRLPHRILTFALDGRAALPRVPEIKLQAPDDPGFRYDADLEKAGALAYAAGTCSICHGPDAIGGGTAPDLRGSPYIVDQSAFLAVVREGALVEQGMPEFDNISPDQVDAIRYYLRARARTLSLSQRH
jgi:quinohemoprotein ethanol dehydrogenase